MSKRHKLPVEFTHRVRDTCLCLHTQRAARALARRFDDALRPTELTNGQFSLLISLTPAVAQQEAHTANLKPLERRGLVKVAIDPADKRSRHLTLTPAGHALLVEAAPLWKRAHAATERLLNADPGTLRATLRTLF